MTAVQELESVRTPSGGGRGRSSERGRRLRRRRWILATPVLALLLWSAVALVRPTVETWLKNPDVFPDHSGTAGGATLPGETYHTAVLLGPLPDVKLLDADVVLAPRSGPAATAVSVCDRSASQAVIGVVYGSLARWCDEVEVPVGQDLAGFGSDAYLVMSITPLGEDPVTATAVDLTYRRNGRTRTERVQTEFRLEPDADAEKPRVGGGG